MNLSPVSPENASEYVRYCRRYGPEHDDSFLPDDRFLPDADHPAYLLFSGEDTVGAAGLMRAGPYCRKGKGRLTVLHAIEPSTEHYGLLLNAVRNHTDGLQCVFGFLPEAKAKTRRCWEALGFTVERYVYSLAYCLHRSPPAAEPQGYRLTALGRADEAELRRFCDLWNRNYADQAGSAGATLEYLVASLKKGECIPDGMLLLSRGAAPVATVLVQHDDPDPNSAYIAMLSVHPDHRGRGLGRFMLRKALKAALREGLHPVFLSVNAGNESALRLYLSEGFTREETVVCYSLAVG